jgi:hypothetical protein
VTVAFIIEPLGAHDRSALACGVAPLDRYLREQASQDVKRGLPVKPFRPVRVYQTGNRPCPPPPPANQGGCQRKTPAHAAGFFLVPTFGASEQRGIYRYFNGLSAVADKAGVVLTVRDGHFVW